MDPCGSTVANCGSMWGNLRIRSFCGCKWTNNGSMWIHNLQICGSVWIHIHSHRPTTLRIRKLPHMDTLFETLRLFHPKMPLGNKRKRGFRALALYCCWAAQIRHLFSSFWTFRFSFALIAQLFIYSWLID